MTRTSAGPTPTPPTPRIVTFVKGGPVHCTCADFGGGKVCRHIFAVLKHVSAECSSLVPAIAPPVAVRRLSDQMFDHLIRTRWFMNRGFVTLPAPVRSWPEFQVAARSSESSEFSAVVGGTLV